MTDLDNRFETAMQNNLFRYATSELSQDAFLCWLASFALDGPTPEPALRACAHALLEQFVPALRGRSFTLTDIQRQVNHIDVLLTVVTAGSTYKIIVEDKTFTSEHGGQLKTYLHDTQAAWPGCIVCGVYYKTGFQSDLSHVQKAGYQIIRLEQILALMKAYLGQTQNAIFLDYYAWWSEYLRQALRFQELPPARWNDRQIFGFYHTLQTGSFAQAHQLSIGYGYVPHPRGGFDGLWMAAPDNQFCLPDGSCTLYLQLESAWSAQRQERVFPICLKLSVTPSAASSCRALRNKLVYDQSRCYRFTNFGFHKPARLGNGRHMTIGESNRTPGKTAADLQNALSGAIEDYRRILRHLRQCSETAASVL